MRDYEPIITVLTFLIDAPAYRAKSRTSSYLSGAAAKLKAEIRGRYRDRITNYIHDIVVHIGDNPSMNRDIVNTLHNHGVMLDKHIRQY